MRERKVGCQGGQCEVSTWRGCSPPVTQSSHPPGLLSSMCDVVNVRTTWLEAGEMILDNLAGLIQSI